MLTWRTYRDPKRAPVPVLEKRDVFTLSFRGAERPDRPLDVPEYVWARGLSSGEEWEDGGTLPASALRKEPVLIERKYRSPLGFIFELAEPNTDTPSRYDDPIVHGNDLIIPHLDQSGPKYATSHQAKPLGRGVFQVPRGFPQIRHLYVGGEKDYLRYDHDPYHGTIYIESEQDAAVPPHVDVDVVLDWTVNWRIPGTVLAQGDHIIRGPEGPLGILRKRVKSTYEDRRVLAQGGMHSAGTAHAGGGPVADQHLYVVRADADMARVHEAVDRTLPAGSLIRSWEGPYVRFTYSPHQPETDEPVAFTSTSEPGDAEIDSYEWTIENQTYYGDEIEHTFTGTGHTTVRLAVTDAIGVTVATEVTFRVYEGLVEPEDLEFKQITYDGETETTA